MQVFGIIQASNRELTNYVGFWNYIVFQNVIRAFYAGVWSYVGFPVGNSRVMQVFGIMQVFNRECRFLELFRFSTREFAIYVGCWSYVGFPVGNSRVMQVFWNYVGVQTGLTNYVCVWTYVGFSIGNSRIMQVFGFLQVSQQGIRELCRFLELCRCPIGNLTNYVCPVWTYVGFSVGNSRIMQVLETYAGFQRDTYIIRELCRCLELCRFPNREFAS